MKQRSVANEWSIADIVVEYAPLLFERSDKKGGSREIRSAPWGYIQSITDSIIALTDTLDRYILY